jgi:hypothetical protein
MVMHIGRITQAMTPGQTPGFAWQRRDDAVEGCAGGAVLS